MSHLLRGLWAGLFLTMALMIAGCTSVPRTDPFGEAGLRGGPAKTNAANARDISSYALQPGDDLTVTFVDVPPPGNSPLAVSVREDGNIVLIYNKSFHAAGKTISELEKEIQTNYVPSIFAQPITVTIVPANRYFAVDGEVKLPNRYSYPGRMTVLNAIATAGGFTDFANTKNVQLTRSSGGKPITVNTKKALDDPSLDLPVYPGDRIHVKKSLW